MRKYYSLMSRKTKGKCVGVIILTGLSSILISIWPVKLGELYTAISNGNIRTITQAILPILTFGLIYLSAECITVFRRVMLDCVIAAHESEIRDSILGKLLHMPVAYYSGSMSGERTAQLNQGVSGFSQLIKVVCNDLFSTALIAVCTLLQVFLNAPPLMAGIMLLYLIINVTVSCFQIHSQNGVREKVVAQKNMLDGQVCQAISNLELIRNMNAGNYEKNRLKPGILSIRNTEQRHHRFMGAYDSLKQICKVLFQIVILALAVLLISQGRMTSGSVITVCLLFQQLIKPIEEVYRFIDETASSLIKAKALLDVAYADKDPVYSIESRGKEFGNAELRFRNTVITNPEKTKIIAWYEDTVIPCDSIALIQGPNGSGKSSLARCAVRYYPHAQGEITFNGRPISTISQKELTDLVYYTPQNSSFFKGTVRENLHYGLERTVSDEEMISALRNVGLTGEGHGCTVLREKPMEVLECQIGEKADELSGGMKQRLNLARAFLRSPRVFIFDEITANLDEEARDFVLGNIEAYAASIGAGIVYISHDENVAKRCKAIITIHNKIQDNAESQAA